MDTDNSKLIKMNMLWKTWERCRSIGRQEKSKSCHTTRTSSQKRQVAPEGCFSVYVGEDKQRFVMKAKYASHPLFVMLLEDAESEYGFNSDGPLMLPCDVDLFYKVLAEIDMKHEMEYAHGSCSPFSPARRLGNNSLGKGCGSYSVLTPSRLIKMNSY